MRVTAKQLEEICKKVNNLVGVDHYSIESAYGGYRLESDNGKTNPLSMGFVPARECYATIQAYLYGFAAGKASQQSQTKGN